MRNIFNRFSPSKENGTVSQKTNPWAGLASYEDPAYTMDNTLTFYGRDDESYDVAKLISNNIIVTLYGRSGVGKTSLLNAGVFPELRLNNYMPIGIRLGVQDNTAQGISLQSKIVEAIERRVDKVTEIEVIEEQSNDQDNDFLWNYFVRHRFFTNEGREITPVLVFDQFEELYSLGITEVETLLRQLDYINDRDHYLDNWEVNGESYKYEVNYRFVLSIREDDLYKLEDSIDNCFLPALKRCRYRLHGLSRKGVKDVILMPCYNTNLFDENDKELISDKIIEICGGGQESINTLMLSLLCYVLYNDSIEQGQQIKALDLDNYKNIIQEHYLTLIDKIPNKQRKYLEDNLVDEQGRRKSIYLSDFRENAPEAEFLTKSSSARLLNVNGNKVELVHDQLAAIIHLFRSQRYEDQRTRSIAISLSSYLIIAAYVIWSILLTILHASWGYSNSNSLEYILEIESEISVNNVSFDFIKFMILSQLGSCIVLAFLIVYELPKKICEYFYSNICIKRLSGVICGVCLTAILSTKWFLGVSVRTDSAVLAVVGWVVLYVILIISNLKKNKNEKTK